MNAQEARQRVVAEAWTWLGTPYHPRGRIKGVGVDCAMLPAEVYETCGLMPHIDAGDYPTDWHENHTEELFREWLLRAGARRTDNPKVGDLGLWKFGRTFSHGGIVVADDFTIVHSYLRLGVIPTRIDEAPLHGRLVEFWSVITESA